MRVSSIHIYPIKSLRGVSVATAAVENEGLRLDRRRMLVDEDGQFLTQRKIPEMALIGVSLTPDGIRCSKKGHGNIMVPYEWEGELTQVRVWASDVMARRVLPLVDEWFSEAMGQKCSLVQMTDESERPVYPDYALPGEKVSFADGFPLLVISKESLELLNSKLEEPLPMNRFRPNIVIEGCLPHEEDTWERVRIGEAEFRAPKLCGRCKVTTTNQETAEVGVEPLRTLAGYRQQGQAVMFGINWTPTRLGHVTVGDEVVVLEKSKGG